jgi:hypothetical protein
MSAAPATRDAAVREASALMPEPDAPADWHLEGMGFHRALDGVVRALDAVARERPVLLVLDDWQWVDAASLRLLGHLVGEIAPMRISRRWLPTWRLVRAIRLACGLERFEPWSK